MSRWSLGIWLFVFLIFTQKGKLEGQTSPYFQQLYEKINANIDRDNYQQNIDSIDSWVTHPSFEDLDCIERGRIYHRIGVSFYLQMQEAEALVYFQDSVLAIWKDCPRVEEAERANIIYNIGICYQYQNDLVQAKYFLDQALSIFEHSPSYPKSELAEKYFGIGNFYHDNFDMFRAALYYEAALKIFRELPGSEVERFDVLNELLAMSSHFNQFDEAQAYFDEAVAVHSTHPDIFEEADLFSIYQNMGIVYFEQKAYRTASRMGDMALRLVDKVVYPKEYALVLEMLGAIKLEEADFDQAIDNFQEVACFYLTSRRGPIKLYLLAMAEN